MVFKTLDGEPVTPTWLRRAPQPVLPAPFSPRSDEREQEYYEDDPSPAPQHQYTNARAPAPARMPVPASVPQVRDYEPEAYEHHAPPGRDSIAPPPRRSSLPPRMSAPPPSVVITRPPRLPSEKPLPPPAITPAEQEAFALAALEIGSLRARILASAETELLELAVSIAEAIIEREIERDPAIHATLAKAAVAALGDTSHARLRVSRTAHRAITQIHGEAAVDVDGVRVELTLDNSLEGLSVVAESGASRVDGRVSERLSAVLRAIEADHRRKDVEGEGA